MSQRIYWVPHTRCFLGCAHCHNSSSPDGQRASRELMDRIIAHLPDSASPYRLEDVLIGGGEALLRGVDTEYLTGAFRQRYPRGPQATVAERRAAGHVILALQTTGLPLADRYGRVRAELVDYWVRLGVDYFQVASSDLFHRRQRPNYPWDQLEDSLRAYSAAHGIEFLIYGKSISKLVPSGRVLHNLPELRREGADLLTAEHYCADGWETGSRFLSGTTCEYPRCSEVVIAPDGWVHACCWYELSLGLFDLGAVDLAAGMEKLRQVPLCQALDQGDILRLAEIAGLPAHLARSVRERVGDCGACRLLSIRLASQPQHHWLQVSPLAVAERAFCAEYLGREALETILEDSNSPDQAQI